MPTYINTSGLTFNGPINTSNQFSEFTSTIQSARNQQISFYLPVSVSSAGHLGITLQFNPDPLGQSDFGWKDYSTTDTTILNVSNMTALPQTDASIASGNRRGGIIDTIGTYELLIPFNPLPYSYRLKFEFDNLLQATVSKISISVGA